MGISKCLFINGMLDGEMLEVFNNKDVIYFSYTVGMFRFTEEPLEGGGTMTQTYIRHNTVKNIFVLLSGEHYD